MSELANDIQERLDALPEVERNYYGSLLESAKSNPFSVMNAIRNNETDPQYAMAAHLALAAITELVSGQAQPSVKTDQEALEDVQAQIEAALVVGDKVTAARLQASLENAAEKTAADQVAIKKLEIDHAEMMTNQKQAKLERFHKEIEDERRRFTESYERNGLNREKVEDLWEQERGLVASRLVDIFQIS